MIGEQENKASKMSFCVPSSADVTNRCSKLESRSGNSTTRVVSEPARRKIEKSQNRKSAISRGRGVWGGMVELRIRWAQHGIKVKNMQLFLRLQVQNAQ
ncbi:hypothetical protein L596_011562 [Steinernema carpocapsae]|uniref:Uncharacterized protein n=1 Tax=Steinernema carpocapsae TaxID=34508 RepID=A0A4U5NV86_STECR|nr:hypothetical protein L596_011562 [Steinernema carpocapsae]